MDDRNRSDAYARRLSELEARLAQVEAESRKYLEDCLDLEQQNTNLANLYVASFRLHSTLIRTEVLAGIEEIIVNLIGSEELAIVEIDPATRRPRLALAFGLEAQTFEDLPDCVLERVNACIESRDIWVRDDSASCETVTACVPLLAGGEILGAIVVGRLLQQKTGIDAVDYELFGLLATHAASALYCTTLHAAREEMVFA